MRLNSSIRYESNIKVNGDFIRGYSSTITQIEGLLNPRAGIPYGLRFFFTKIDPFGVNGLIGELIPGDYIVASQTTIDPGSELVAIGSNQVQIVGRTNQFLDCVYRVDAIVIDSESTGHIDVNVTTDVRNISETGNLGYLNFGVISSVTRSPESQSFSIPTPVYTDDMSNFPTLVRTKGGLRDRGGIAKRV